MRNFLEIFGEDKQKKAKPATVEQKTREKRTPGSLPETLRTPEEDVLETREKRDGRVLRGNNVNTVEFIYLKDDGGGVFKPKEGETEMDYGVEVGTYYKRERAAYLIDRFIGFGLVPPTVVREINASLGSLQEFIPDAKSYYEMSPDEKKKLFTEEQFVKLWIFDLLISNPDRHGNNLLIKNERIYAIDHGCSLGGEAADFRLRNPDTDEYIFFYDRAMPQDVIDQVQKFARDSNSRAILQDLLCELLSQEEVDAFFLRLDRIAKMLEKGYITKSEAGEFMGFGGFEL